MSTNITVEHDGQTYNGSIMQIESTHLGMEDHGLVTAYLHCKDGSSGIGVGGYGLDAPVTDDEGRFSHREGTGYGLDHLMQFVRTVGVDSWEKLPGQHVIVLFSGSSVWGGRSIGIASLTGDRVFILAEHAEAWKASHPEAVEVSS